MSTFFDLGIKPKNNQRVRITQKIVTIENNTLCVTQEQVNNRKAGATGLVVCAVKNSEKQVYYVTHDDYSIAAYRIDELIPYE